MPAQGHGLQGRTGIKFMAEGGEKQGPLVPPVPKQFRVVGGDGERWAGDRRARPAGGIGLTGCLDPMGGIGSTVCLDPMGRIGSMVCPVPVGGISPTDCLNPLGGFGLTGGFGPAGGVSKATTYEVPGIRHRLARGGGRLIGGLGPRAPGHPIVPEPRRSGRNPGREEILQVRPVPGQAQVGAAEKGHPAPVHWRLDPPGWGWLALRQTMGLHQAVGITGGGDLPLQPRIVTTLWQPEPRRHTPSQGLEGRPAHPQLGRHCPGLIPQQGGEAVGRRRGQQFHPAGVVQPHPGGDQIPAQAREKLFPACFDNFLVPTEQGPSPRISLAPPLRHAQALAPVQVSAKARRQTRVREHGQQGRGQGEAKAQAATPRLRRRQDLQQGQIAVGDGLVEPVLLQGPLLVRLAHVGQVRMEHQGQLSDSRRHG